MAQTYEIDINWYNGTDYDTLLPTPATHAATHKANGTDPIVCQTGNYGDKTVTGAKMADGAVGATQLGSDSVITAKIANANVTRAKLANDALYSLVALQTASLTLAAGHVGQTLVANSSSSDFIFTVPNSASLPVGYEVAIFNYLSSSTKITFASGVNTVVYGETAAVTAKSFALETYAMVALKKLTSDTWLLTGPAEVA